jgi:hypothetical protein
LKKGIFIIHMVKENSVKSIYIQNSLKVNWLWSCQEMLPIS